MDKNLRFDFGNNWLKYSKKVNNKLYEQVEISLEQKLGNIKGKTFLDVGCGSGIFSLAASNKGAIVQSFDYDKNSVASTLNLKKETNNTNWSIEQGDILDNSYIKSLANKYGYYDIVYSWGVLHHTGDMYKALENSCSLVKNGGILFISIYNDQGIYSKIWRSVKKKYNSSNYVMKKIILYCAFIRLWGVQFIKSFFKTGNIFYSWNRYYLNRGMSPANDVIDWVGGYPFEVAKPEEIFKFIFSKGFKLIDLKTCGGAKGCNEFIFVKDK